MEGLFRWLVHKVEGLCGRWFADLKISTWPVYDRTADYTVLRSLFKHGR